jgi:hypothetical protein
MPDPRPVLWQETFIRAVDEPDTEILARLIHDAELAIFSRRQQIANPNDYCNEVRAMDLAMLAMDAIKVQRLGSARKVIPLHHCRPLRKSA